MAWETKRRKRPSAQGLTVNSQDFTCLVQRPFPLASYRKHSRQPQGLGDGGQKPDIPARKISSPTESALARHYRDCAVVLKGCALCK